jgi:hypothetical protein
MQGTQAWQPRGSYEINSKSAMLSHPNSLSFLKDMTNLRRGQVYGIDNFSCHGIRTAKYLKASIWKYEESHVLLPGKVQQLSWSLAAIE